MNIEELITYLRARINPQYYDQLGTESYERHQVVKALEYLATENERLKELMAKRTREHQQEMTSFRLRVRSQDDATFAALREENERLRENAKIISELEQLAAPKPAAPATCKDGLQVPDDWREVLVGLIAIAEKKGKRQGSPNHCHSRPGIWDDDNIRNGLAGKPCSECALYDRARAAQHPPAVVEAWHWIKTYCRHWATTGHDWQTTDNLTAEQRPIAERHLQTLREAGLLVEGGFRGNFEVKEL